MYGYGIINHILYLRRVVHLNLPKTELRNCPGRNALVIIVKMYIYNCIMSIILTVRFGLKFPQCTTLLLTTWFILWLCCAMKSFESDLLQEPICKRNGAAKSHLNRKIKQTHDSIKCHIEQKRTLLACSSSTRTWSDTTGAMAEGYKHKRVHICANVLCRAAIQA